MRKELIKLLRSNMNVLKAAGTSATATLRLADNLIDGGATIQKWTPVSEPPAENGYYLCYVLTSAVGDRVKYEQMPLYWEDYIWLYRPNSYRMCRNVTHWTLLPMPPKGE